MVPVTRTMEARPMRIILPLAIVMAVKALGDAVFAVAARPGLPRGTEKGMFRGSFACAVRQTFTREGDLIQIG
jgi:hypothetical protein